MGIQGLLPLLDGIAHHVHISELSGKKVAIDVYCWLHKGVYSCSTELCQGIPTDKYVQYCMKRLHLLLQFNVVPIVVFDGGSLPIKKRTEEERRKSREEYRTKGLEFIKDGNIQAANECFQKAVDVTPTMAYALIKALRRENIEYIVAPYEADAQLAFLSLGNFVECVITEDSDLLAYGCARVLFKMDKTGNGKEIRLADITSLQKPSFLNFTQQMLRHLCILAGCDYTDSIAGLGIKKAHNLMRKYRSIDKIFAYLKSSKIFVIPLDYEQNFKRAELTFLYQRVFDPTMNAVVTLTPLPSDISDADLDFLGPPLPDDTAVQIAVGNIDPHSKLPFLELERGSLVETVPSEDPDSTPNGSATPLKSSTSLLLPVQKNSITNYFSVSATTATKKPFVPPRTKLSLSANDAPLHDSAPPKKQKTYHIEQPNFAPQPKKIILSKYFVSSGAKLSKSLFVEKGDRNAVPAFSSPLINNAGRLSLCSVSCGNVNSLSRFTTVKLQKSEEEEVELEEEESIKSDEEEDEVIKSDDEEEIVTTLLQ